MSASPRQRLAQRFSRRWFYENFKTLLWVAAVTVLVWIYADLYFTDTRDLTGVLRIRADGEKLVLLSPQTIPLSFRVKGNRYAVDRFADRLARNGFSVYDAGALGIGAHTKRTLELLEGLGEFRGSGLQILLAQPEGISIKIDQLKSLTLPVRLGNVTGGDLADKVSIVPEKVVVTAPGSLLKDMDPAKAALYTENLDLRHEPADKEVTRELALQPLEIPGSQLSDRTVKVTFRLQKEAPARRDFTINVQVQAPRGWEEDDTWSRYKLEIKNPLEWSNRAVTVVGPRSDLDKLRPQDINAFILLKEDDKSKVESWLPGQVQVSFPPGLDVRLAEPLPPLDYKLVKRPEVPAN
jgi:hypothetical protein